MEVKRGAKFDENGLPVYLQFVVVVQPSRLEARQHLLGGGASSVCFRNIFDVATVEIRRDFLRWMRLFNMDVGLTSPTQA